MTAPLPDAVGVVERLLKRAPVIANPNDRKLLYACSDVIQSQAARIAELEGERITTAAIKSGGVVVTIERPGRHGECINWINRLGQDYMNQGFLTNTGRFVDRREAGRIAVAAGQATLNPLCNGNLFSEDVWPEPFECQARSLLSEGEGSDDR